MTTTTKAKAQPVQTATPCKSSGCKCNPCTCTDCKC